MNPRRHAILILLLIPLQQTPADTLARVLLNDGRAYQGILRLTGPDMVSVAVRETSGGEIVYRVSGPRISQIDFPAAEDERVARELWEENNPGPAASLLKPVVDERLPFLPWLSRESRQPLLLLLQTALANAEYQQVISLAGALRPHLSDPQEAAMADQALLRSHAGREDWPAAVESARAWCRAADPGGDSALGWAVLAESSWVKGKAEETLWYSLQPLAFSSAPSAPFLDQCYAAAILAHRAAERLGEADHLRLEMLRRGLPWPDHGRFAALDPGIPERAPDPENSELPADLLAGPPQEDLDLPLQLVRKLIARQP